MKSEAALSTTYPIGNAKIVMHITMTSRDGQRITLSFPTMGALEDQKLLRLLRRATKTRLLEVTWT